MGNIKGTFAGYTTDGVLVAASSPLTESAEKVLACQTNGAAAAILKTASGTRLPAAENALRRCMVKDGLFWAKSSFNREILTLEQGESLIRACRLTGVTIPLAASVTELSLDTGKWLEGCARLEAAGADALQLDFFYIENLLSEPDFGNRFVTLLREIVGHAGIPVMPKLNIALPAGYAADLLKQAGIKYVSLLDSIKTPPPVIINPPEQWAEKTSVSYNVGLHGGGLSVFGSFMFPLTAQYTDILARAGFEVCAGGGVVNGGNAANLLVLGASSVQVASDALINGYGRFSDIQNELNEIEENAHPPRLLSMHGRESWLENASGNTRFLNDFGWFLQYNIPAKKTWAELRNALCDTSFCSKECVRQAFCSRIQLDEEGKPSFQGCEGCGLCADLCPREAIDVRK